MTTTQWLLREFGHSLSKREEAARELVKVLRQITNLEGMRERITIGKIGETYLDLYFGEDEEEECYVSFPTLPNGRTMSKEQVLAGIKRYLREKIREANRAYTRYAYLVETLREEPPYKSLGDIRAS